MSQREKIRREFVNKDASGNITTMANDIAFDVLLAGAQVKSSGATISAGASGYIVEVYHPGRLDKNHRVRFVDGDGNRTLSVSLPTGPAINASGVWEVSLDNDSGSDITFSENDRLVIEASGSTHEPRAKIYKDDTGDVPYDAASNPPTGPQNISGTGIMEFYTDESEVDIELTKNTDGSHYGYLLDVTTGGHRETVNPRDWGAANTAGKDSWPGFKRAVEYVEDDRNERTIIHVPAGDYELGGPIRLTEPGIEIRLDRYARISSHGSWAYSTRGLFEIDAPGCIIRGGELNPPADNYGVVLENEADRSILDSIYIDGGASGVRAAEGCYNAKISECTMRNQGQEGIYVDGAVNTLIRGCDVSDATFDGIRIESNASVPTMGTSIVGNKFSDNARHGVLISGNDADVAEIRGTVIQGNMIRNNLGRGIRVRSAFNTVVNGNSCYNNCDDPSDNATIEGANADMLSITNNTVGLSKAHGIMLRISTSNCLDVVVSGNNIQGAQLSGIWASNTNRLVISGNHATANNLSTSGYEDIHIASTVSDCVATGNLVGTNGADWSGVDELGHNLEL